MAGRFEQASQRVDYAERRVCRYLNSPSDIEAVRRFLRGCGTKMLKRKRVYACITTLLPALVAGGLASAQETHTYEMVAYVDGVGSEELFAGRYAEAIESASAASATSLEAGLRASAVLCVAFTVTGDLSSADAACARTLRIARRVDALPSGGIHRREESGKARSNLGVLKALRGDEQGAAEDFQRAARMSHWDGAARNLAQLEALNAALPRVARNFDE